METIDKQFSNTDLSISTRSRDFLLETAKWANFLAIVGFVMLGLMVLGAIVMLVTGATYSSFIGGEAFGMGIAYLIAAVLYFFPTYYLFHFAKKMKNALMISSQDNLEVGFENLKSFFKFVGILMIVVLSLYILIILIAVIGVSLR